MTLPRMVSPETKELQQRVTQERVETLKEALDRVLTQRRCCDCGRVYRDTKGSSAIRCDDCWVDWSKGIRDGA